MSNCAAAGDGDRIQLISRDGAPLAENMLAAWSSLIDMEDASVLANDVTASPEWATALGRVFLESKNQLTFAATSSDGMVTGVFPMFTGTARVHRFMPCRDIALITDIHAGRAGFVTRHTHPTLVQGLLEAFGKAGVRWDRFCVTVVSGSNSDRMLEQFLARGDYRYSELAVQRSPYIYLPGTWDSYWTTLDGKLRSQLRNREKKLAVKGHVAYMAYDDAEQSDEMLCAIMEIERESWKHEAGTSIDRNDYQSQFYKTLLPMIARRGWLSGHVLTVDSEPIAYLLGIRFGRQFIGLKHSFKSRFRDVSAGNLIQMMTIRRLIEQGVRIYDFMGNVDPHKQVWTECVYERKRFLVYNNTATANMVWSLGKLRSRLGRFRVVQDVANKDSPNRSV